MLCLKLFLKGMENNNVDLESASSRIKGANVFVGLTEVYHESLCLLHHFVHEALPQTGCDCTVRTRHPRRLRPGGSLRFHPASVA